METKSQLVVVVLCLLAVGQVYGRGELCKKDEDCNTANGQRCQRFDKCKWGSCVCGERMTFSSTYGACSSLRKVGESCNNGSNLCLDQGNTVDCSTAGSCTCATSGWIWSSGIEKCVPVGLISCRKHGESCTDPSHTCCPGSMCIGGSCKCDDHTAWYETGMVCVHQKAMKDLEVDERCTAPFPTSKAPTAERLCKKGLVCASCPEDDGPFKTSRLFCRKNPINSASALQMSLLTGLLAVSVKLFA